MKKSRSDLPAGRCTGGRWENIAPSPATAHGDVPDELLELVFLRLPSSLHLIRTACTCKRCRRVVADAGFLLRFQALHPRPEVAGHYLVDKPNYGSCPPGSNPVFSLSQSTDTTVQLRPQQHFSLEFLPLSDFGFWKLADSRGGLLLLCDRTERRFWSQLRHLVVCNPMTRCCSRVISPPVSDSCCFVGAFLLNNDADEAGGRISLTNFRITIALYDNGVATSYVFSSTNGNGGGCWTMATSKVANLAGVILFVGHVAESAYWTTVRDILLLDKDAVELKLSSILLPNHMFAHMLYSRSAIVRCHDGTVRIALLQPDGHLSLRVLIQSEDREEWVQEKSIQVPQLIPEVQVHGGVNMLTNIVSVVEGSVTLGTKKGVGLVYVDLATMEFKRVEQDGNKYYGPAHVYQLPWPPTLRACLQ